MSNEQFNLYYENDWLGAIVGDCYFLHAITAFVCVLLLYVVFQSRSEPVPSLFHRIKGRWTNGEYDFIIYFSQSMYEPRIRIIEKEATDKTENGQVIYNDYRLRIRGRKVDFHNGQFFIRITSLSKGELRLLPGSDFTRMPELFPELSNDEGHVWNR